MEGLTIGRRAMFFLEDMKVLSRLDGVDTYD